MLSKILKVISARYSDRKNVVLFMYWIFLTLKRLLRIKFYYFNCDNRRVDVVIPTVPKDFEVLLLLVESLKYLKHEVNKIYIVAPSSKEIVSFCDDNELSFIDELDVLGFGKEYIKYMSNGIDRSGWLFQQLLKLSGDQFTEMDDYLVVDSDTVFVNYNCFIEANKYIFLENDEWNQPYFDAFERLFNYKTVSKLSLTSHMMIFNHALLGTMKKEIEQKHGQKWYDAYISSVIVEELSSISDYDTYANWVLYNYPAMTTTAQLYNKSLHRDPENMSLQKLSSIYRNYNSISFHSYLSTADD